MKDLTLAIVTALKANTALTTYGSPVIGTRIYRKGSVSTNPTIPYITVSRVDSTRDDDTNTGHRAHSRIQCTGFETNDFKADTLSELIADALHRMQNATLAAGTSNVYVISVKDAGMSPDENTDIPLYWYNRDFMIHYSYR